MLNKIINIQLLFVSAIILVALDFSYLYINQNWYKREIKNSQGYELNLKWSGVIIRYLSQIIGLNLFVLQHNGTLLDAFIFGVVYGYEYTKVIYSVKEFQDEFKQKRYSKKKVFAHNAEYDLNVLYDNIYELDKKAIFNGKFISVFVF